MKPLLFAFPSQAAFATALARHLEFEEAALDLHEFPDGETRVRLDAVCAGRRVIILCGGQAPNRSALPLYFAAATARELGAVSVGLVSPYMAYLRQDRRFHAGEALSAAAFGRFLSESFDWLVTVDPHLHRIRSLDEVLSIRSACVSSVPAIAEWIAAQVPAPVIVGPDAESAQWVNTVAARLGAQAVVLEKTRSGDHDVRVSAADAATVAGRTPVIVDDIASSGHTLARTVEALMRAGSAAPVCVVIHALFAGDAERVVRASGAARVVSANTVAHHSNAIDVSALVAEAVRGLR
jgi:ribose-phosphate pyrophosphokinase